MTKQYVGIDVSKATLDVAVMAEDESVQMFKSDNNAAGYTKLKHWLSKRVAAGSIVCMEATGRYSEGAAEALHAAGYHVSVVNPARIRGYADAKLRRNKTDPLDAKLIADFARTQQPARWTPPSPEMRELQGLVHHLATLEEQRQIVNNRLRDAATLAPLVKRQLQTQRNILVAQIEEAKRAIQDHINRFPDLKRQRDLLESIPGLGLLTAAKLLATCRPLTQFTDVRQLVAFAGLNPAHHQSGTSINRKTLISKKGAAAIRAALYMPAIVAKRHNPILKAFAQRLLDKGKPKMAVIVAVMRKLLHLAFGVLKSGRPFDPNFGKTY